MAENAKVPSDTGRDGTTSINSVPCPTLVTVTGAVEAADLVVTVSDVTGTWVVDDL